MQVYLTPDLRVRAVWVAAALGATILVLAGCGGSSSQSENRSLPIETVEQPTLTTYRVPSSSMEPTLHCQLPGSGCEAAAADYVEAPSLDGEPQRGDILVFTTPSLARERCGAGGTFIKRVVGLPGETWEERNGFVYIDGKKLIEPYVKPGRRDTGTSYPKRIIPAGTYFMMGDNRTQSCDSREWGPVPKANLIGKVVRILRTQ
jgi:signal peptidase I